MRYFLDVLLTPRVVDGVMAPSARCMAAVTKTLFLMRKCFAPVLPFFLWHVWTTSTSIRMLQGSALFCLLRAIIYLFSDNHLVVGDLTKRDIWPLFASLVWFCRVSSGRVQNAPPCWYIGERHLLCVYAPWLVRCAVVGAISTWLTGSPTFIVQAVLRESSIPAVASHWVFGEDKLQALIRRCYDGYACTCCPSSIATSLLTISCSTATGTHAMQTRVFGMELTKHRSSAPI